MGFSRDTTLREIQQYLEHGKHSPDTFCPACSQKYQVYRRNISSSIAIMLITAYRLGGTEKFVHVKRLSKILLLEFGINCTGGGDFAALRRWKLIEERPLRHDEDKKNSGWWRVTERGERFVLGKIRLKKYAIILKSRFLGLEGDFVSIKDCLKKKFSYRELLHGSSYTH